MEDLAAKLSEIVGSEEGMKQIQAMASSLFANAEPPQKAEDPPPPKRSTELSSNSLGGLGGLGGLDLASMMSELSPEKITSILKISKLLGSQNDDDRTRLLLALKPHLSPMRRERVDKAVRLLRLASILPLINEMGFKL